MSSSAETVWMSACAGGGDMSRGDEAEMMRAEATAAVILTALACIQCSPLLSVALITLWFFECVLIGRTCRADSSPTVLGTL